MKQLGKSNSHLKKCTNSEFKKLKKINKNKIEK